MKPIRTPDAMDTMVGPEGSDIEPLPVQIENDICLSTWELDPEDREKVEMGGRVALLVWSNPQPPVALTVAGPDCKHCNEQMLWSEHARMFVCPLDNEAGHEELTARL